MLNGLCRILFIGQTLSGESLDARIINKTILRWVFVCANTSHNLFIGKSDSEIALQRDACHAVQAIKDIVNFLRLCPGFEKGLISSNGVIKNLHNAFKGFSLRIAAFQVIRNKKLAMQYKKNTSKFQIIKEVTRYLSLTKEEKNKFDYINVASDYFVGVMSNFKSVTTAWEKTLQEIKEVSKTFERKLLDRYGWTRHLNSTDFLMCQALLDRHNFVFSVRHMSAIPVVELFDEAALSVITLIEYELRNGSYAYENILLFGTLLERGLLNSAEKMGWAKSDYRKLILHNTNIEWRSGRVTWDRAIELLDTTVENMRLLNEDIADQWISERQKLISKQPSVIDAFINALRKLWDMQTSIFIFAINHKFKEIAKLQNFQIYNAMYIRFQEGYHSNRRTFDLMVELVNVFPVFKGFIKTKPKGLKFVFHGLFVTYFIARRDPALTTETCPETLKTWGKSLKGIQENLHTFLDAALILSVCNASEKEAVKRYLTNKKGPLVPIFMPLSHETVDRADFALKNKSTKQEAPLIKKLTLGAMNLVSKKLPDELKEIQNMANGIMADLSILIKADRGTHHKFYDGVIDRLHTHFFDDPMLDA